MNPSDSSLLLIHPEDDVLILTRSVPAATVLTYANRAIHPAPGPPSRN